VLLVGDISYQDSSSEMWGKGCLRLHECCRLEMDIRVWRGIVSGMWTLPRAVKLIDPESDRVVARSRGCCTIPRNGSDWALSLSLSPCHRILGSNDAGLALRRNTRTLSKPSSFFSGKRTFFERYGVVGAIGHGDAWSADRPVLTMLKET